MDNDECKLIKELDEIVKNGDVKPFSKSLFYRMKCISEKTKVAEQPKRIVFTERDREAAFSTLEQSRNRREKRDRGTRM